MDKLCARGCGRPVSENKSFCLECSAKEPTHIILNYKTQDVEILFRASDGICIGQRKACTIVYGDRPNKRDSHVFLDKEYASRHLRGVIALNDAGTTSVVIEDRDGEHTIIMPEGVMELPTGISRMH